MNKQMTLRLQNTEPLVTVWRRLGQASREELARRFASLIAQVAQAELGPADKEGTDEPNER